jgi:excisionase family DNA binding protein
MANEDKAYYSLEDVAARLDVNYQLIYRLVRDGELPSTKIGRVYRVSHEDLTAYLERNRTVKRAYVCEGCGKSFQSSLSLREDAQSGKMLCMFCSPGGEAEDVVKKKKK